MLTETNTSSVYNVLRRNTVRKFSQDCICSIFTVSTAHFRAPGTQMRSGFVPKSCLVGYFFSSNNIFHLLFPPRATFVPFFSTPRRFRLHVRGADEATAAIPPPMCNPVTLGTRTMHSLHQVFVKSCLSWPPTLFGRTSEYCMFCRRW